MPDQPAPPAATPSAEKWETPYHKTIKDLRRELIESEQLFTKISKPHRDAVWKARCEGIPFGEISDAVRVAHTAGMMAAGYAYTLAAVLGLAEKLDPAFGSRVACLADNIIMNGGDDENADITPAESDTNQ